MSTKIVPVTSSATTTTAAVAAKNPTTTEAGDPGAMGPGSLDKARWASVVVGLGLVITDWVWPGLWGMASAGGLLGRLLVLAVWAVFILLAGRSSSTRAAAGFHLLIDVVMLTALLAFLGAASNPFTMLYFVPITLATLVSRGWTWWVALSALAGFAALFAFTAWSMGGHGHGSHLWRHLLGMGVALGIAGTLVTYFVHRIASALQLERQAAETLRQRERENSLVASLGALSAGAAHELGTPLGTIQLLSGELALMGEAERNQAIETIRHEVARCKDILHGMSSSELSAHVLDATQPWRLGEFEDEVRALARAFSVPVEVSSSGLSTRLTCRQPRPVLIQTVRELLTNAQRACPRSEAPIHVHLRSAHSSFEIEVTDHGTGMTPTERQHAFEPFRSGRDDGRGLGLFLARVHLRQLGGQIDLQSTYGEGTQVTVSVPVQPPGLAPVLEPRAIASGGTSTEGTRG